MPRKRFVETPVDEPPEEAEEPADEELPQETTPESERQIEEPPVKPKTVKQLQKEAEKSERAGCACHEGSRKVSCLPPYHEPALLIVHPHVRESESGQTAQSRGA